MSVAVLARLRQVRRRERLAIAALALPWVAAGALAAWWLFDTGAALATALVITVAAVLAAAHRVRRFDQAWLATALDARRADMEDSSALLFVPAHGLRPLQQLQRGRLEQRLQRQPPPDLSAPWPWRMLLVSWVAAAVAVALPLLWPGPQAQRVVPATQDGAVAAGTPRLESARLRIEPPAYTGLEPETLAALDAKAPVGSRLAWRLRIAPQPVAVALEFLDGERIALERDGDVWTGSLRLQRSQLYRVRIEGAPTQPVPPLHRLDAIADRPPQVRVLEPETTLQLRGDNQRQWRLAFEASDDHAVAVQARLRIVRTEGSGENQTYHEHTRMLAGQGGPRRRRYAITLDIADFGLGPGEDLAARLEVTDTRQPQPQPGRSASVILRWPPPQPPDVSGLEGLARQVLPAYFRSQRQIIIDAQALIAERARLDTERFATRSDALGVDQRLLRLRYGQFLGEESEGSPAPPPGDSGHAHPPAPPRPAVSPGGIFADGSDALPEPAADHGHGHGTMPPSPPAETAPDDHEHADGAPADGVFGRAGDVVAAFGHTHDIPEAATLLDPKTRETLRRALNEMWQSELHLRQAQPDAALPYAHRALEFIKQVQEADRIYLARVGAQLPPIDGSRRLSGKREGLASRPLPPLDGTGDEARLHDAWWALADHAADPMPMLDALQAWADGRPAQLDDPLALVAAIDAMRNDADCTDCRAALRGLLWHAMRRPAAGIAPRVTDDGGARYLRALQAAEAVE